MHPRVLRLASFAARGNSTGMKLPRHSWALHLATTSLLAAVAGATEAPAPPQLRYKLPPGPTNANPLMCMTLAKGLGRLEDPRAAEPLAELIAAGQSDPSSSFRRDMPVAEELIKTGPPAESAVLALLKEKHTDTHARNDGKFFAADGQRHHYEHCVRLVINNSCLQTSLSGRIAFAKVKPTWCMEMKGAMVCWAWINNSAAQDHRCSQRIEAHGLE
jgi:hypothetical protein